MVIKSSDELAERLLDSYHEVGGINNIDGVNLPSKNAVDLICRKLQHLLFPGFYCNEELHTATVAQEISKQLSDLQKKLSEEIAKSLEFSPPSGKILSDFSYEAREITSDFLEKLPCIRQVVSTDVEAAFEGDPAAQNLYEIILAYPGIEAISIQRMAHELNNLGVALIPRMMTEWAHQRTGIDIHPGARIGPHFFIDHGTGVVIGETCDIGHHVKMYHGVTLGARSTKGGQQLKGAKRHPTIEDYVTIYPGATILGGETIIGTRSTIGGNVFLLKSVEPDSVVSYEEGSVLIKSKKNTPSQSNKI